MRMISRAETAFAFFAQPLNIEHNTDFYSFNSSYTTSDSSDGSIRAGMNNTIVIPSSIFTNSYFYKHEIVDGNGKDTWPTLTFYGDNSSAENTTAHVSGVIYGNITGDEFAGLLTELSKNTTGAVTYNYTTDDPYQINLPGDVLKLVPFSQYARGSKGSNSNLCVLIENSPTQNLKGTSSKGVHNSVNGLGDLLGYSIGPILAFTGLLAPIVIPAMNLDHRATVLADIFAVGLSFAGLWYSRWLAKKDASVRGSELSNPLVSKIELATSIAGVASPIIKLTADIAGGD